MHTETTVQKIVEILGSDHEEEIRTTLDVEKPEDIKETLNKIPNFEEWKVFYFEQTKMDVKIEKHFLERGLELAKTVEHCLFVHSCASSSSDFFIKQILEQALGFAETPEECGCIFPKMESGSSLANTCILKMAELIENPQGSQDLQVLKFRTN